MNIELLPDQIEKLESVFLNMLYMKPEDRIIAPDVSILDDMKVAINNVFDENKCISVSYTQNTDKPYFGIRINPLMSPSDAVIILSTEDEIRLNKYEIEFDSNLFEMGLNESELCAVLLYEIDTMMCNNNLFENIRAYIDAKAVTEDEIIGLRDSVNYAQLIIFALKDTMYKMSSVLFAEKEAICTNKALGASNLIDDCLSAFEKIKTNNLTDTLRTGNTVILDWMFTMYRNISNNNEIIKDTLKDATNFTGSKLEIKEIEKALNALDHIDMDKFGTPVEENSIDIIKFFEKHNMSAVTEASLFGTLRKNGLKGIENELYEYSMRVRNCTEADDAYLIMRGLNNRIGILEDYLYTEQLSGSEYKHWSEVLNRYKDLRIALSNKKFKDKQYGLFFDYSKLDHLDDERNANNSTNTNLW